MDRRINIKTDGQESPGDHVLHNYWRFVVNAQNVYQLT
jgi:hypothetical protein